MRVAFAFGEILEQSERLVPSVAFVRLLTGMGGHVVAKKGLVIAMWSHYEHLIPFALCRF